MHAFAHSIGAKYYISHGHAIMPLMLPLKESDYEEFTRMIAKDSISELYASESQLAFMALFFLISTIETVSKLSRRYWMAWFTFMRIIHTLRWPVAQ